MADYENMIMGVDPSMSDDVNFTYRVDEGSYVVARLPEDAEDRIVQKLLAALRDAGYIKL